MNISIYKYRISSSRVFTIDFINSLFELIVPFKNIVEEV